MKFFYFCINRFNKEDLKRLCLSGQCFLTQETVERILDKYPAFFNDLNLHIVNKEQEESWIKARMADNINYYKNLMPMENLLCH